MLRNLPVITKNILILNILMFVMMMILDPNGNTIYNALSAHYFTSVYFEPYQIITHMFMHSLSDPFHIFFNMFLSSKVFNLGYTKDIASSSILSLFILPLPLEERVGVRGRVRG